MAKVRIYVVDLESVPTRYTCEWKWHVPALLNKEIEKRGLAEEFEIINISGGESMIEATPGAFLNFQQTNIYKNNQLNDIATRFTSEVQAGDKFLFTDAWNTSILQLKYMSELLNKPVEIHALWHAGSYDKYDFLGRLVGNKPWVRNTEKALFHATDKNYFATEFHVRMFMEELLNDGVTSENPWFEEDWEERYKDGRIVRTGWPMDYMPNILEQYKEQQKENIIIFPHRLAPEKQPEIFRDLAESLPEYRFVICQDQKLSKKEYHELLAKSKIMWSANLQETLGISPYEGAVLGVIPLLPDRLSYTEMYTEEYLYPSKWTENFKSYTKYKENIIKLIHSTMRDYDRLKYITENKLASSLLVDYFSAGVLVDKLLTKGK